MTFAGASTMILVGEPVEVATSPGSDVAAVIRFSVADVYIGTYLPFRSLCAEGYRPAEGPAWRPKGSSDLVWGREFRPWVRPSWRPR